MWSLCTCTSKDCQEACCSAQASHVCLCRSTSSRHLSISPGIGWFGSPAPYVGGGYAVQSYGGGGGGLGNIIILAVGAAIVYGLVSSFLDNRSDSGSASDTVEGVPCTCLKSCDSCKVWSDA